MAAQPLPIAEQIPVIEQLRQQASQPANPESQPAAERFNIVSADCVYDAPAPLDFLVEGLFTRGSVNLLVGDGGSGKTWIALDLAVCVASGARWLDFQTNQGAVLIVDEESGIRRLNRRLYETLRGHLVKREEARNIHYISLQRFDASQLDDTYALEAAIIQKRAALVIVDALADVAPGADENSVKDMLPVFINLRGVAERTQAAIIVIHHSNKTTGAYRGSTAIKGAVDLMLQVDRKPESKYIDIKTDKARDIEPVSFTALATFVNEPPQFYLRATEVNSAQALGRGQRYVLRYLLENEGEQALDELMEAANTCAPTTARTAVYNLIESGHIKTTAGGKGRGKKSKLELTPKGRELAEVAA